MGSRHPLWQIPCPKPCTRAQHRARGSLRELHAPQVPVASAELGACSHPPGPKMQLALQHSRQHCDMLCHAMPCYVVLTEPHTGRDGDEGHDAAEAAVDSEQRFVELAGGRVGVVLVEEGEGSRGEGVEGSGGQQHSQVPALVLCCTCQPAGKAVRGSSTQAPTQPSWHSPVLVPGVRKGSDQHQLDEDEGKATADACIVPRCRGRGQP